MNRRNSTTPCPVFIPHQSRFQPRDSLLSVNEETTTLEFTRAFGDSIRSVKPRRRQTAFKEGRTSIAPFAIHEDDEGHCGPAQRQTPQTHAAGNGFRASMLAQPPQRLGRKVGFAPEQAQVFSRPQKAADINDFSLIDGTLGTAAKRVHFKSVESLEQAVGVNEPKRTLKPARRGTIFIPNDDTTMPSMYMGIFSPIKDLENGNGEEDQPTVELTGIAAKMAKKRSPRQSLAAAPPRRVPLQNSLHIVQEAANVIDVAGVNGGKENLPPGFVRSKEGRFVDQDKLFDLSRPTVSKRTRLMPAYARRKPILTPTVSEPGHIEVERSSRRETSVPEVHSKHVTTVTRKPAWNSGVRLKSKEQIIASRTAPSTNTKREEPTPPKKDRVPSKFGIPRIHAEPLIEQYPLLTEDISNPAMYEESWLTHQEIAITQLVNNLFCASRNSNQIEDERLLRIRFLEVYQEPKFPLLYTRLQASLLYGALSVPADTLAVEGSRLRNDLGMRSRFVNLWLHTYSSPALKTALEVVVGRSCKTGAKPISDFISTFIIRNEDASPDPNLNALAWSYHRTLLRSLMLVLLLDRAKITSSTPSDCLFLPSSHYKSSTNFIKALSQLLNPAVGDVIRALSHVDYHVQHIQYPLEEYEYHISNLAIDLRDGVKLTRLAELLLYPSASRLLAHERDADATTTVIMPDGETLNLDTASDQQKYPLSQHLKFPCLGRATKTYNVQVALSALQGVRGMELLVRVVTAEDIVDGYREKTVALLWGLTGRWGLGGLIDWKDVRGELRRLTRECSRSGEYEEERDELEDWDDEEGFETYKALLKKWASAVARRRGIRVTNLTTSFADGKAFEAIVDEYEPYLSYTEDTVQVHEAEQVSSTRGSKSRTLHERLTKLGCSVQFAQLFAPTDTGLTASRIFDRTTTLAALAFLCSRLLLASRRVRAAIAVQKAWRRKWARVVARRKLVLKGVAEGCRDVVWRKERARWAQGVIWSAWLRYRGQGRRTGNRHGSRDDQHDDGDELDLWLSL